MALFDKAITFTDIHLGLKNNSKQHNEDCLNFIKFMIDVAKKIISKFVFLWEIIFIIEVISISKH